MTTANSDTVLLTEHFGYPPVSLLDEIINSINFLAERALASVETGLLNAPAQQIGFGKPPVTSANSKSKRKRKQPPPPEDVPELSPEEIEEQAHNEIANGTHQLETLLCTSIDRNFDKFELYVMRNILCVKPDDRDWIRLGHYEGLNFENLPPNVFNKDSKSSSGDNNNNNNNSDNDNGADKMDVDIEIPDVPTVDSINRLRRRLQASQKLNTMLTAEKARNDALLGELRALVGRVKGASKGFSPNHPLLPSSTDPGTAVVKEGEAAAAAETKPSPFAFLHEKGDLTQADATTPLTTTTAFSLSQIQALRALSTSLSNILPDLRNAAGGGAGGGDADSAMARKTWRKERVEYVESAARRHLEKVGGLELGPNGEVRDGEWQDGGRRLIGGEVGALENVVEMLGGGETGGKEDGDEMEEDGIE